MTLTEFLLARIAEDEAAARAAQTEAADSRWMVDHSETAGLVVGQYGPEDVYDNGWISTSVVAHFSYLDDEDRRAYRGAADVAKHIARHDPRNVLRQCQAKRDAIAALDVAEDSEIPAEAWVIAGGALRAMAAVYADHPDYNPGWKP